MLFRSPHQNEQIAEPTGSKDSSQHSTWVELLLGGSKIESGPQPAVRQRDPQHPCQQRNCRQRQTEFDRFKPTGAPIEPKPEQLEVSQPDLPPLQVLTGRNRTKKTMGKGCPNLLRLLMSPRIEFDNDWGVLRLDRKSVV